MVAGLQWQRVVVFISGAMLLASLHRVAFSVLAVPFAVCTQPEELPLSALISS